MIMQRWYGMELDAEWVHKGLKKERISVIFLPSCAWLCVYSSSRKHIPVSQYF